MMRRHFINFRLMGTEEIRKFYNVNNQQTLRTTSYKLQHAVIFKKFTYAVL